VKNKPAFARLSDWAEVGNTSQGSQGKYKVKHQSSMDEISAKFGREHCSVTLSCAHVCVRSLWQTSLGSQQCNMMCVVYILIS